MRLSLKSSLTQEVHAAPISIWQPKVLKFWPTIEHSDWRAQARAAYAPHVWMRYTLRLSFSPGCRTWNAAESVGAFDWKRTRWRGFSKGWRNQCRSFVKALVQAFSETKQFMLRVSTQLHCHSDLFTFIPVSFSKSLFLLFRSEC